ncbi:MAG: hypothetical protein MJZ37_07865 [Bacilli bacterium]|nr:hypothetical protein [Bacilli bacterium]
MEMSIREICESYRLAKNQKEQIEVLADLNACDRKVIIAILKSEGAIPVEVTTAPASIINLANERYMAAGFEIDHCQKQIEKIKAQMDVLITEQKEIKRFLNGIRKEKA